MNHLVMCRRRMPLSLSKFSKLRDFQIAQNCFGKVRCLRVYLCCGSFALTVDDVAGEGIVERTYIAFKLGRQLGRTKFAEVDVDKAKSVWFAAVCFSVTLIPSADSDDEDLDPVFNETLPAFSVESLNGAHDMHVQACDAEDNILAYVGTLRLHREPTAYVVDVRSSDLKLNSQALSLSDGRIKELALPFDFGGGYVHLRMRYFDHEAGLISFRCLMCGISTFDTSHTVEPLIVKMSMPLSCFELLWSMLYMCSV